MTFKLEAAITRKVMKLDDRRQHNGDPCFREKSCTDHTGKKYASISDMARAYDLPATIVIGRFYRGWDKKTALTAPIGYRRPKTVHTDHEGNVFSILRERCVRRGAFQTRCIESEESTECLRDKLLLPGNGISKKEVRNDTNTAC